MTETEIWNAVFDEENQALRVSADPSFSSGSNHTVSEILNAVYDSTTNTLRVI